MNLLKLLYFLLIFLPVINSLNLFHRKNKINFKNTSYKSSSECNVQEFNFTAKVDNFDDVNLDTFHIKYYTNDEYVDSNVEYLPVFLQITGEWTELESHVCNSGIMNLLAEKHKGLLVVFGHRFFGENYPYFIDGLADASTKTLSLLTPQQALADLANFIQNFEYKNFNFNNTKWVLFGGSYAGTLCAYMRKMYPELSVGGVCSSAPLTPKLDYFEYLEVSTKVYKEVNEKCAENIKKAFKEASNMIYTDEGRDKLNELFNTTLDPYNSNNFDKDVDKFFYRLVYSVADIQNGPIDRIENTCNSLTVELESNQTYIDLLANIDLYELSVPVKEISSPKEMFNLTTDSDLAEYNNWFWMTCNNFGWYQSTKNNELFQNLIPLGQLINDICIKFGSEFTIDYIQEKIQKTIDYFGTADTYNATNVVLVNNEYDPWHPLGSYINDEDRHQKSILIPESFHCYDLYSHDEDDTIGLANARKIVEKEVEFYLSLNK